MGVGGGLFDEVDHRLKGLERVVQQDVALADMRKDVVLFGQTGGQGGDEGRELEVGAVDPVGYLHQAHQVDRAVLLVEVVGIELKLPEQEGGHRGRAVVGDFQPYRRAVMPLRQLALQGLAQVLGFLVVDEQVGVAGDAELVAAFDLHAGEQLADMGVQDRRQEHEAVFAAGDFLRHADDARQRARRLHHGGAGIAAEGVAARQLDREVEALVEHAREGVRRVEPDWRQHRHQLAEEVIADPGRLGLVPVRAAEKMDALLGQLGDDVLVEELVLAGHQCMGGFRYGAKLLARRHAVGRALRGVGADLLLEAGDPHLEKLVHVAGEDAEKFQPLQQGHAGIVGLRQYAALEFENAELTVDEGVGAGGGHGLVTDCMLQ